MDIPPKIKLVIVGNAMVGKTCLLSAFVNQNFKRTYKPTVFDNITTSVVHKQKR
jgi:GTPase SAR1 family protein